MHKFVLKSILFIFLVSFFSSHTIAQQLPTGQWRYHFSYSKTNLVEAGMRFVYGASGRGFFKVQMQNHELTRLSTLDGFHGAEITCLYYYPEKNILLIGYNDGYIDLLKNETEIIGIDGFFNKQLQGDKSVLHCNFHNSDAFVSTNFGLLVIDLDKNEIRDSYTTIGSGGQPLEVLSSAILGDSIYAGIQSGIIAARFSESVNLNDYNNWHKVFSGKPAKSLTFFADSLFFFSDSVLFSYKFGVVKNEFSKGVAGLVRLQKTQSNTLAIFRHGGVSQMNAAGKYTFGQVNIISSGSVDYTGTIWYTSGVGGGIIMLTLGGEVGYEPNGPANSSVFAMSKDGDYMFCTGGGVTNTFGNAYNPAGFYIYNHFRWVSNPASTFNQNLYDYTFVHYNPVTEKTYVGTHTNGMLEFKGFNASNKFDETNSTLFRESGSKFIRVSGIASDPNGNLWVCNFGSPTPLNVLSKTGTWTAVPLPNAETQVKNLVIDNNGYKWMIVLGSGVLVFDDNKTPGKTSDDRVIKLTTNQGLITNDVLSLAADRNGYVWIGTTQGLNVVTNTFDVFSKPKIDRFIIEQNGTVGYLLGEETINDILVDGGNRKWFATNNGVFLAEPDGQKVLLQYSVSNSPLPDNKVICIGQIGSTGEVFFGTDNGIISYHSDASNADDHFKDLKIYPNPVKPGYAGNVTIEGLAQDAEIRITDAAGVLIYQTKANGGTAIWPGTRLDGSKPNSGVLYVFGMNTDGTETAMGKFIYIK